MNRRGPLCSENGILGFTNAEIEARMRPNPFIEILERQGPEALVRALETEPHLTPALKAAIHALKVYAVVPFA